MDTITSLAFDAATITTVATIAVTFPRLAYAGIGIVGTVAAVSIAGSAVGVTLAIVALGMVLALADGGNTVDTGYLDRPPHDVVAPPAAQTVRFLAPVWADDGAVIASDAEADRLLAQYSRAIASRHKTRAAKYRAAWIAHTRSTIDGAVIA